MDIIRDQLVSGLQALSLSATPEQTQQLLDFISLIAKWNKAYNLTAIRRPEEMVGLHILDSLAIAPYVSGKRIIDIGTGAGLPGIPLAIILPDKQFVLLDCNAKKTRFVQQALLELKLENVEVRHQRVEDYQPDSLFDTVITRAFANLADIVRLTAHLSALNGVLLAMKGQNPELELAEVTTDAQTTIIPITVPGVDAQRCLIKLEHPSAR